MKAVASTLRRFNRSSFAALILSLAVFSNVVTAQEKGGQTLLRLSQLKTPADVQKVEPGDTVVMSCPKCKDSWVKLVQPPGKGGHQETAVVPRHECPGCGTKIVIEGVGRDAKSVVKHTCKQCGSQEAYCCVMKKGAKPTPAMEGQPPHQH